MNCGLKGLEMCHAAAVLSHSTSQHAPAHHRERSAPSPGGKAGKESPCDLLHGTRVSNCIPENLLEVLLYKKTQ